MDCILKLLTGYEITKSCKQAAAIYWLSKILATTLKKKRHYQTNLILHGLAGRLLLYVQLLWPKEEKIKKNQFLIIVFRCTSCQPN